MSIRSVAAISLHEVPEALAKSISYTLSPGAGFLFKTAFAIARWPSSMAAILKSVIDPKSESQENRQAHRSSDREIARDFLSQWGIELISSRSDRWTGFALMTYKWGDRGELVFLGSDDAFDWWHNLTDREIGLPAYYHNRKSITTAIAALVDLGCLNITARGHSLGGGLAQYAYLDYPEITRCVTYQGIAISGVYHDHETTAVTHYFHRDDIIPRLTVRHDGWFISGTQLIYKPEQRYRHGLRIRAHMMPISCYFNRTPPKVIALG
jgi:hypothetical protein